MSIFGLDIGSDTIKAVQVVREKNVFKLHSAGLCKNPVPDVSLASDKDLIFISDAIKKLLAEIKINANQVTASLPERMVFSHLMELPKMNEDELENAIHFEAENLIPSPLEEVNIDWVPLEAKEGKDKISVHVIAAPKILVNKYIKIIKDAGLEPSDLETEMFAIVRCLKYIYNDINFINVNFGLKSFDIGTIFKGNLQTIRSLTTSGEAITRSIALNLGLEFSAAEEYKKTYGLSDQFEGKVSDSIKVVLDTLANEVKKAVRYFEEQNSEPIKLISLTGGSSLLPGIAEYFLKTIGIETQIADPFFLFGSDLKAQADYKKNSPFFSVALGLAVKNI